MVRYLKAVKAEFCFFGGVGRGQPNSTTSLHHCTRGRGGGGARRCSGCRAWSPSSFLMIMAKHTVVRPLHSMSAPICTHLSVFITAYGKHADVYRSSLGPLTQWQNCSEGGRDVDNSEKVVLQTRVRDEGRWKCVRELL